MSKHTILTVRAKYKNGQVTFGGPIPIQGEHNVLITFLEAEDELEVVPKAEYVEWLKSGCGLAERELEVLQLARDGLSNNKIADKLCLATGSVRNYLSSIYIKLNVHSRTSAVARAIELGLIKAETGK